MLNDEKVNNFINSDYYASKQINYFNKKHKNFNQNQIDISFPIINSNRTFSKYRNHNHVKTDFISTSNYISNKNINKHKYSIEKEKKGILYKKRKMKEMNMKKEDNEQIIIRDINRKIKSIYDNLKNSES